MKLAVQSHLRMDCFFGGQGLVGEFAGSRFGSVQVQDIFGLHQNDDGRRALNPLLRVDHVGHEFL